MTIYDIVFLEREILLAEDYTVENRYLKEGFTNHYFEYTFNEYNQYFGGVYSNDGRNILCITEDSPIALIDYLDENNVLYTYVKYNYSELLVLSQVINNTAEEVHGFWGLGINEKDNRIVIYTSNSEDVLEYFRSYVDEGVLVIIEAERPVER
jgi:hypothetical protein